MKTVLLTVLVGISANLASAASVENSERALIAYMKVKPGAEQRFLKEAEGVIEESRLEQGNITYQLHQSVTNPQQFVFYELFVSDAALQFHRNAAHVKSFLNRTKPYTVDFRLEEFAPNGELNQTH